MGDTEGKRGFPEFNQEERKVARDQLIALFKSKDGKSSQANAHNGIKEARDNELSQAEFETIEWSEIESIIGTGIMNHRFKDLDGDNKITMRDVWLKLDSNQDSTVTPDEFMAECLGEAFCTHEEAMEAYDILRDQNENLPIEQLGDGLRALGLNPTEVQVMEMANKYDTNADGEIDTQEWNSIVKDMLIFRKDDRRVLKEMFATVAKDTRDGDGKPAIATEELVFIMSQLGTSMNAAQVKKVVSVVDASNDGLVQYEEFVTMVQKLPAYVEGDD
eukprot:m.57546 g.57546  ORF g.57546 m.57546 type:complete len:275 (-) comp17105_c0_seq1:94-918(-)